MSGTPPEALPGTVCDHCGQSATQAGLRTLKSCSACQAARFCSAECIGAAWPEHKKECKAQRAEVEKRTDVAFMDGWRREEGPSQAASPARCGGGGGLVRGGQSRYDFLAMLAKLVMLAMLWRCVAMF